MKLADIFKENSEIKTEYRSKLLTHFLREPTSAEDLDFRRASARVRLVNGRGELSLEAIEAPIKLYDAITVKVTAVLEDGSEIEIEDRESIPNDVKVATIEAWQGRCKVVVAEKSS